VCHARGAKYYACLCMVLLQVSGCFILSTIEQRLVVDLSSPENWSVNDGIDTTLSSLSYTRVEQVAQAVLELGPGTQLAKIDVKSANRIIPVHPDDWPLLGMR
jgi:hypothetical protein